MHYYELTSFKHLLSIEPMCVTSRPALMKEYVQTVQTELLDLASVLRARSRTKSSGAVIASARGRQVEGRAIQHNLSPVVHPYTHTLECLSQLADSTKSTAQSAYNGQVKFATAYIFMVSETCSSRITFGGMSVRRSQCPRGLKHELSSPAQTLGSWVRIPLQSYMSAFIPFCVALCAGTGWSPVRGVLLTV
jgi:hypothetical protein